MKKKLTGSRLPIREDCADAVRALLKDAGISSWKEELFRKGCVDFVIDGVSQEKNDEVLSAVPIHFYGIRGVFT